MDSWTVLKFLSAVANVVAIARAVVGAIRWGGAVMGAVRRPHTGFKPTVPRETIRAVPSRDIWWHMGSQDGLPAMQIATRWLITNISDRPTMVARASMSRGWFRRKHEADMILEEPVPVDAKVEVMIDFWVHPPFRKEGESFNARLTLVDHLGNPHRTDALTIPSDWRPKREEPKPTEEVMHAIGDPLVKHVVAILRDEVNRYRECGRPVGGLGSVEVTHENRTLKGIGYQGRETNSPRRQWIVSDPDEECIHSYNLDGLMTIFNRQDEAKKQVIVDALLQRITLESEYTPVGYFFVLALFRMGQLPTALHTIKAELVDDKKYGFDDAVRMLSGLLQYEYPSFDDPTLDEVERFMVGLDGSAHYLKERCVAARAVMHNAKEIKPYPRRP